MIKAERVPSTSDRLIFKVSLQEQVGVEQYLNENGFPFTSVSKLHYKAYQIMFIDINSRGKDSALKTLKTLYKVLREST